MKIAIGSDHRGRKLKDAAIHYLRSQGYDVHDVDPSSEDSVDYPDFARLVAESVSAGRADRGILICATGIGMSIAANKVKGVRAALCHNVLTAQMSRKHNDANVLSLGAEVIAQDQIADILQAWLGYDFEKGRHERRIKKISDLERS